MASVKPNYGKDKKIISYRWRAFVGRDEVTGKQKFATKTVPAPVGLTPAKALKQMQAEANRWEKKVSEGEAPVRDESFKWFIDNEFLPIHVKNGKHSPATVQFYTDICDRLVKRFGRKNLDKIKSIDVERYLVELQNEVKKDKDGNEKRLSAAYVKHHRTVLMVCFNFAEKHGKIEHNPMRKVATIQSDRKQVDFLTDKEVKSFLVMLDKPLKEEETDGERYTRLYWKAAMYVFIYCGLRRGELAGIQWGDIDFDAGVLDIKRNVIMKRNVSSSKEKDSRIIKETKTKNADRQIPIPLAALTVLKTWKSEQQKVIKLMANAFVFGCPEDPYKPIRPDSITQWLTRFEERHGLRKVSPHDLRHTCGTLYLQSGASVKEVQTILGHADASTTLRFYVGTDPEKLKDAADRFNNMIAVGE